MMNTPWRVEKDERCFEVNGRFTDQTYIAGFNIVDVAGDEVVGVEGITDADDVRAAHIVLCVNSHDRLIEALRSMVDAYDAWSGHNDDGFDDEVISSARKALRGPVMRDDIDLIIQISKWQRAEANRLGITLPSVMDRKGLGK